MQICILTQYCILFTAKSLVVISVHLPLPLLQRYHAGNQIIVTQETQENVLGNLGNINQHVSLVLCWLLGRARL